MEILKKIETELIQEWHQAQMELIPHIKAAAIRAYYLKFRSYQKHRDHLSILGSPATIVPNPHYASVR